MVTVRLVILLTIPIRANGEHVRPNSEDAQPHGPTMANVSHNGTYFENQHHPNGSMSPGAGVRTCIRHGLLPCAQQAQGKLDVKIRYAAHARFAVVDGTGVI